MRTNILWTGREYHSIEHCSLQSVEDGFEVSSTIVGYYQNTIYKVDYHLELNERWETLSIKINSSLKNVLTEYSFYSDGKGNWNDRDHSLDQFKGCVDIDIPLTPFTNTLPINRLELKDGEEAEIDVLYLDLLAQEVRAVKQKYKRSSNHVYHYENIPNDFDADIQVDDFGLVTDYPKLFIMTAKST
ncbi:putative glycolipid-binding domain-containing protein [Pseudochryseolinea flava]|uniref:Transcriptional regulator n=1 Tax=Pseudochryseolinea flava TaxID=2059302 RepID=A0A364Y0D9_9BACT|nr:putative glycolipid-binding domain-containing protein [Pseudochryseolinea flava]RAV99192.1 transcriptional regulator [Pseudochryseolinea flava]